MRRSRFTAEQIIGILGEQETGVPTAEVCRKHRYFAGDVLRLEDEVWRHECVPTPLG